MLVPVQSTYKWHQVNFQVSASATAVYHHTCFAYVLTTPLTVIKCTQCQFLLLNSSHWSCYLKVSWSTLQLKQQPN